VALAPNDAALLRVSIGTEKVLNQYAEGVYIATLMSRSIKDLQQQVCADRLVLAEHFLEAGHKLMRAKPPQYRSAISRYYYSMYHSMRSVVYFTFEGDDHEAHAALPGKTPKDFVNAAVWQNNLKDARERRNEADYDPYPSAHTNFAATARDLRAKAIDLSKVARAYLKQKGCGYV
jgi:uncharacterized protein (UPF0332 family)